MVDRPEMTATNDPGSLIALHQEVLLLRSRLAQRESAFAELNRRLRQLEHGESLENDLLDRALRADLEVQNLQQELTTLLDTKTFRYTATIRRLYGRCVQWVRR